MNWRSSKHLIGTWRYPFVIAFPYVIILLFLGCPIIVWCISYCRRNRFWTMKQQPHHVPPPLAADPGPVTSNAAIHTDSAIQCNKDSKTMYATSV